MKNYIVFNNLHSYNDLGLLLENLSIPIINENVENVEVEGRNGTLTAKGGGFSDRIIPFRFTLIRKNSENIEDFIERIDLVNNWLEISTTSMSLVTYLRPNKKYIVKSISKSIVEIENARMISIEGEFVCDPFLYEIFENCITLMNPSKINYNGNVVGECNIKIFGSGNTQLTINNETVQINNVTDSVELDSKLLLCLNSDKTSKLRDMTGNFLVLESGINDISWTGNVTKVEIIPRTAYR